MKRKPEQLSPRMRGEPATTSRWTAWRTARGAAIASPARNKAAQKLNGSAAVETKS